MKLLKSLLTIPVALTLVLASAGAGQSENLTLRKGFQPNPRALMGTSGGAVESKCGKISPIASHTVNLQDAMDLVFSVEGSNSLTLMIQTPDGNQFCAISDGSDRPVTQPGYWTKGKYDIFVGELTQTPHSYTLKIAAQ